MKILIDLQACQSSSRYRGVGRYALEISKHLIRIDKDNQYIILLNSALGSIDKIKSEFYNILPEQNILCWLQHSSICSADHTQQKKVFISEVMREVFIQSLDADILFIPNFQEGWDDASVTSIGRVVCTDSKLKIIATIHDVIPVLNENEYIGVGNPIRPWYLEKLFFLNKTDVQLTDTFASKKDIDHTLSLPNLHVVPCGIDKEKFTCKISSDNQDAINFFDLDRKFILYSGGMNPHKNLNNLYVAYAMLPAKIRKKYCLVLAGKKPADIKNTLSFLEKLNIKDDVVFTDYITDTQLVSLYNTCSLFAFPSYQEGFGMPPLEAMASGAVVIAADIPVMREVVGQEIDAFFDPFEPDSIKEKIIYALTNDDFRLKSKENAAKQVEKYNWDHAAGKLLDIIHSIKPVGNFVDKKTLLINAIKSIKLSPLPFSPNEYKETASLLAKNIRPVHRKPTIFIDISSVVHEDSKTGIQRVVRAIIYELLKVHEDVMVVYSFPSKHHFLKASVKPDGSYYSTSNDELIDFYHGDKIVYLDLHPALAISHRNFNCQLKDRGVEVYYVIYDLIPIHKPESFVKELSDEFANWIVTTSYANGVICISQAVADEYIGWLSTHIPMRKTELKVGYFHLGADIKNSVPSNGKPKNADNILTSLHGQLNFIMVGTLEPRKGHLQMLSCFEELWSQGVEANLLIVGKKGWLSEELVERIKNHNQLGKRLYWFNGVSDEYLDALYKVSSCLIAASEAEGFGLPLIEAGMKGISIIARDIPVFREVAGEHAFYFKGLDAIEQSVEINQWIDLWHSGQHPVSTNMKCLTWQQSAEQFWDCLSSDVWYHTYKFNEGDLA